MHVPFCMLHSVAAAAQLTARELRRGHCVTNMAVYGCTEGFCDDHVAVNKLNDMVGKPIA